MADNVTCGQCGEPITDEPADLTERKPCPKCGSTARTVSLHARATSVATATAQLTVIPYPEKLLNLAQKLIDDGECSISVVVAHMACEIATERSLSKAFAAKGISYLEDPVRDFLNGYNLSNKRIRTLYIALTGDQIEKEAFWEKFTKSAERRNRIMHASAVVAKVEAEESYHAASSLIAHMKK